MPVHFTTIGPRRGSCLYRDAKYAGAVGVIESPDKPMPIGMALIRGWRDDGVATWKLTVHGAELDGLWVVVDRAFRPAG